MSKRAQLVCQHLENISRAALEEHQDIVRQFVRSRQGVYALYRKGKLYYVGLATNLRNRLTHHLRDRHGSSWDRFSVYLTIGDHHLRELEALMLRVMKPTGNKQTGKFARSEDLRRGFRRAMHKNALATIDDMLGQSAQHKRPTHAKRAAPATPPTSEDRPVLAAHVNAPLHLRSRTRGKTVIARVSRDGLIHFAGKVYSSPSQAASAARGNKAAVNGWLFWKYERAPGDWVPLDVLRR